ncbi:MAG: response regulator [Prevotella sp.]|nr:response regulator [Prevotella sp.]
MRKYLLALLVLLTTQHVFSQPYCNVRLFTLRDGLASNVISSIEQSDDQLMWFSSWNGLSCYDGYTFTTFSDRMGHERTLTTNRILKISKSALGNVWCLTYDRQVFLFDRVSCRFVNVSEQVNRLYGALFSCQRIVALPNGHTWLLSRDKETPCFFVDERQGIHDGAVQMYRQKEGQLKGLEVYGVELDEDGREWILTNGGVTLVGGHVNSKVAYLYVKQVAGQVFFASHDGQIGYYDSVRKDILPLHGILSGSQRIVGLSKVGESRLAVLTDKALHVYDVSSHSQVQTPLPTKMSPLGLYVDKKHRVWVFTDQGEVLLMTPEDKNVERLMADGRLFPFSQSTQNFVHEDAYGTVWVGLGNGFFGHFDEQEHRMVPHSIRTHAGMPSIDRCFSDSFGNLWFSGEHDMAVVNFGRVMFNHIPMNGMQQVRSLCFDSEDRLWVGDITGHIAVMKEGRLLGYLHPDGKIHQSLTLFSHHVYCLFEDSQRRMWIGTKGDGLYCLLPNGRISHYRHDAAAPYSLCSNEIYAVHEDHQHRIWVGTFERGISLMQTDEDGKVTFVHADNQLKGYPVVDYYKVRRLTETPKGSIIVSASNGLVVFSEKFTDPSSIRFYAHKHVPGDTASLFTSDVMQTHVDRQGRVLVATVGGGMQEIVGNPLQAKLQMRGVHQLEESVDDGTILSMIEDKTGNLWIGHENSIVMYEDKTGHARRFGPSYLGDLVELTEAQPAYNPRTGQLVFATTSGFVSFHPEKIQWDATTLPLVFKSVYFHGSQATAHLLSGDSLDVPANQRSFTIQFAALDYHDNYTIHYAYMLDGLDPHWNELGSEHSISFSNLSAGKHRLLIRSTNPWGVWSDNIKTLYIYVHPTFWETWWAKLLYLLLFLAAIGIAVWIYRLRTRASMERQLNDMKTEFFTDISHKLRTPLTLIGGPVTQVLDAGGLSDTARQHLEMVKRNAHRMLELVNRMLTYSKEHNTYISDENVNDMGTEVQSLSHIQSGHVQNGNPQPMLRLLIVEDNDDLRSFLVSILSSDYDVTEAVNGQDGLEKALSGQPDFILTDVMMPEMDGLEMVHRIKENRDTSHIPIVILSAKASLDDRLEGLKAGVNDYITKPFSATYLKQRMLNIISNQRLLQQSNLEKINQAVDSDLRKEEGLSLKLRATNIVDSDKQMMERLLAYIEDNLSVSELRIEDLAIAVNMGRTVFYNKVKSIVGMSPVELLRHIRIQHAEEMISKSSEPFSQIAYAVGFSDAKYFGKCFKKQTGLTPSEYREHVKENT